MVDENMAGATLTAVTTANATSVTVDDDRFEVAGGNLKLKDDMSLDFEGDDGGSVDVTITASGDGESAMHTVTVTINDLNEAPTIDVRDGEVVPQKDVTSSLTIDESVMGADLPPLALIEVMDADAADATTGQDGADMVTITGDMADYFEVKLDPENGLWLALKADASLDYETVGSSVMLTVTYTDSAGLTASADVTVMINNVNEAPVADADIMVPDAVFAGGDENENMVDLKALFSDPDGDTLTYRLSDNAPDWLELSVTTKGTGDDQTITGTISGTPPSGRDITLDDVSIIASDPDGLETAVMFDVVVDARNDAPTRVDLLVRDGDILERVREVSVKENVEGAELGMLRVRDVDDARHPHGMHEYTFMVDGKADTRFEVTDDGALKLKDDASLNHEDDDEFVLVITATDMAVGEDDDDTESATLRLTIKVGDVAVGDGPVANRKIDDWWVVVDDDLDEDDVRDGDWLSFSLDTTGSDAAFTDEDGDDLTYTVSVVDADGSVVNWLQISNSGKMTNKKEMLPERGVYTVTVTATDESDNSAQTSFKLAVALSDDDDDDNDAPDIRDTEDFDYTEGSGSRKVASFSVRDDDIAIAPHPYGQLEVSIKAMQGSTNVTKHLMVREVGRDEDSVDYEIWTKSDAELEKLKLKPLDHEMGDEVDITVTVKDAPRNANVVSQTDERDITFDIEDADDEAPEFQRSAVEGGAATKGVKNSTTIAVDQQADKQVIVVLLTDAWDDDDTRDSDLEFDVAGTGGLPDWIKVYQDEWEEIVDRRFDGDAPDYEGPSRLRDNDEVVAIVIDRSARGDNVARDDNYSFRLTAEDDDGNEATETIVIDVTDKNVDIASGNANKVVSIVGNPSGTVPLTMKVNLGLDPDLDDADDAVLVVYTWSHDNATAVTTDDVVISVSSKPVPLPLVNQAGEQIYTTGTKFTATVQYYEIDPEDGSIAESDKFTAMTKASKELEASADPTSVMLEVTTTTGGLSVMITAKGEAADADGIARLEESSNGTSGWSARHTVDADTSGGTVTVTLNVNADGDSDNGDGGGKYYRVVYVYEDEDDDKMEERSEVIQLGDVADPTTGATTPILGRATPAVGDNLRVNTGDNDADIQWQMQARTGAPWMDIRGATDDELRVAGAHAGKMLRAKVTYTDDDDQVVWVEYTDVKTVAGATGSEAPTATNEDNEIRVELMPVEDDVQPAKKVTFDASDLFFDTDGDDLTYTITAQPDLDSPATGANAPGTDSEIGAGNSVYRVYTSEWDADATPPAAKTTEDVQQSFSIDKDTGMVTYFTDKKQTHDGTDGDGLGNTLTFTITATETRDSTKSTTADVVVRINVAPTAIELDDGTATAANLPAPAKGVTGTALTDANGDVMYMDDEEQARGKVADIDVQDQNATDDKFGMHKITLTGRGADQFEVRETDSGDSDGSTWEIWLKRDATFDFEKLATAAEKTKAAKTGATDADKTITLTITVTATDMDGDGLSTKGVFSVKVMDEDTDDDPDPARPTTPKDPDPYDPEGLEDDADDDDQDGPVVPPDDGGAFIDEDDLIGLTIDDDLLGDYVLAIDDIDIA